MKDYYNILDIKFNSPPEDIKRAYRKLALKYHPDQNTNASAEERFIEIREAYEMLRDDQKRKLYNAMYMAHFMNKARNVQYQQPPKPYSHTPPGASQSYTQTKTYTQTQTNARQEQSDTYTQEEPEQHTYAQQSSRSSFNIHFDWSIHGKFWGMLLGMIAITLLGLTAVTLTAVSIRNAHITHNGWVLTVVLFRDIGLLLLGIILQYKGISTLLIYIMNYRQVLKSSQA